MRYTPWIVSEFVPDFSTLPNMLKSRRFAGLCDEALAEALWKLMVDREIGIFHYCPAQEELWKRDSQDPLLIFNVYGFAICHVHAHVLAMLGRAAGYKTRVANITGHEGAEFLYNDKWHYFDPDLQYYHRLRPPHQDTIASREDLYRDPSLTTDQPNPSNPYGIPDRPPEIMQKLCSSEPEYVDLLDERIHSMDFVLRPGEEIVRYFHHRGRWHVFENYPESFRTYPTETGVEGPTERFWPRRQWGNGFFRYSPALTQGFNDAELGADELSGIVSAAKGLVCEGDIGHAQFAFESPYIYCGVPDPWRRLPSLDGANLKANFELPPTGAARIEGSIYAAGTPVAWETLWTSNGKTGNVAADIDFTALVDGHFHAALRFVLIGRGSLLATFETKLWFMVSPHSLPALEQAGENRMSLHCGDRFGLNTRVFKVERQLNTRDALSGPFSTENLRHEPSTYSLLMPKDPSKPWSLICELAAPQCGRLAWVSVYALIEAFRPDDVYDQTPAKIEIADDRRGPWRTIAERKLLTHPQGWHFAIFGEDRFSGNTNSGFVRFSSKKGMKGFRIAAHYTPAAPIPSESPLEVEHVWYEDDPRVGRRQRTHLERTAALSHHYVVRCLQKPHNERIVLRAPSLPK
jgi:hypothetical protein